MNATNQRPYTNFLIRLPMGGTLQLGWNNIFLSLINILLTFALWRSLRRATAALSQVAQGD